MSVTKRTRLLVLTRDEWLCQVCGRNLAREVLDGYGYSLQHRRARGMGGSKRSDTNGPANLVTVCGSATTGCHGWIERHPAWAASHGLRIRQNQVASSVPVWTHSHGWVLLDDAGSLTEVDAPKETA